MLNYKRSPFKVITVNIIVISSLFIDKVINKAEFFRYCTKR